jgi:endonuclease G
VQVPEAFFKVVLRLKPEPAGFGIITHNNEGTKKRDLYYNSIDQVERITGIDFFPALPDDIEDEVEAKADMNDWE